LRLVPSASVATSGPAGSQTVSASAGPRPAIPCCS
jgi:hypothetical protein